MNKKQKTHNNSRILTIPNLLSFFRLCLILLIIWLYCVEENYSWAGYTLILSGITDIVDGFIARRFHMTSDLGKVLDPVADKLTQAAMLVCLLVRFPFMIVPLVLLLIKETFILTPLLCGNRVCRENCQPDTANHCWQHFSTFYQCSYERN